MPGGAPQHMKGAIFRGIHHARWRTTMYENEATPSYAEQTTSLQQGRGDAGAACPKKSLTCASLQHHDLLLPFGEHAEETCL